MKIDFANLPLGRWGDGDTVFTDDTAFYKKIKAMKVHEQVVGYTYKYIGMGGISDNLRLIIRYPISMHLEECFAKQGDFPVSETRTHEGMSLPMNHCWTKNKKIECVTNQLQTL